MQKLKTQKTILTKKDLKEIEMIGEAKNLDSYKSMFDLFISGYVSELDQHQNKEFQVGRGTIPIYKLKFQGSLN